jgi:serine/threonine-protein kinase
MTGRARGIDQTLVADGAPPVSGAAEAPPSLPFAPASGERTVLAQRYELLGLVGVGGMGAVYRAHDLELDEIVALKILRREIADTPGIVESFRREVKLARRVTHPNVARVFDLGEHEGEKFLTMELVDGEPLGAHLASGALDPARALSIAVAVAAALAAAHAAGVAHRDLKPDNVLVARDGRVVVTDFGIARALSAADVPGDALGAVAGTPAYMAPEQLSGTMTDDARADVFAFGALLYELLAGERAFPGETPMAIAAARRHDPAPDPRRRAPSAPAGAAALVVRCLAPRPGDRPASMAEVLFELEALMGSPPTRRAGAPAPAPDKTVAVLPLRNAGGPDDDYLAEELSDDLVDALSMTPGLRVCARSVVARRATEDPRELGRALGVQVVVEGSVRRARARVRVSARVISVADGFQLWAQRIERPEGEVLSINDDVAAAVAAALTLTASAAPRAAPRSPAAVDLYIRARHEYRRFWPEHQRDAVALFDQAEALAPGDPMILAGLALALARLSFFSADAEGARARRIAERAVAAAPDHSEPHLALGSVLLQQGEARAAVRALCASVALGPGRAEAHATLGRVLVEIDAVDEGLAQLDAALGLDPFVPLACSARTRTLALIGRWEEADALHAQLREREGAISFWALRARMALWRRLPAARYVQEVPRDVEAGLLWAMGEALASGALPEGTPSIEALARTAPGSSRRRTLFFQMRAELAAYVDDAEGALDALTAADGEGLIDLFWLSRCPLFDPLRASPRFAALSARVAARARDAREGYTLS